MIMKTPKIMTDQSYVHQARLVSLTSRMDAVSGEFLTPTISAQCSGRIGWDRQHRTHDFVELYRGFDDAEAERARDEHNAKVHPAVEGKIA